MIKIRPAMPSKTPTTPLRRALFAAAALAPLALMAWGFRNLRGEDFVYYYCAGAVADAGGSPYAAAPYGSCVSSALGDSRIRLVAPTGSAYPPAAIAAFEALARLPYDRAFVFWNLLLAVGTLALAVRLGAGAADALLIMSWPGVALCWIYHKVTLLTAAAFFAALSCTDAAPVFSGLLFGLQVVQPQWLAAAALYLAAKKRGRTLAAALGTAAFLTALTARAGWLAQWTADVGVHAAALTSYDNQSLFLVFYKHAAWLGDLRDAWFLPGRALFAAVLAAAAAVAAALGAGIELFLALILLAQPYTHSSDSIWVLPLLLAARDRWKSALGVSAQAASAAFLGAHLLLWWACLYTPNGRLDAADRQGYLTLLALALWGGAAAAARLRGRRLDLA
jgi:hypothetical protein